MTSYLKKTKFLGKTSYKRVKMETISSTFTGTSTGSVCFKSDGSRSEAGRWARYW